MNPDEVMNQRLTAALPFAYRVHKKDAGGTRTRKHRFGMYSETAVRMHCYKMTDEVVTGESPLSRLSYTFGKGGGTRTHNLRIGNHVLQVGSRSWMSGDEVWSELPAPM